MKCHRRPPQFGLEGSRGGFKLAVTGGEPPLTFLSVEMSKNFVGQNATAFQRLLR